MLVQWSHNFSVERTALHHRAVFLSLAVDCCLRRFLNFIRPYYYASSHLLLHMLLRLHLLPKKLLGIGFARASVSCRVWHVPQFVV